MRGVVELWSNVLLGDGEPAKANPATLRGDPDDGSGKGKFLVREQPQGLRQMGRERHAILSGDRL